MELEVVRRIFLVCLAASLAAATVAALRLEDRRSRLPALLIPVLFALALGRSEQCDDYHFRIHLISALPGPLGRRLDADLLLWWVATAVAFVAVRRLTLRYVRSTPWRFAIQAIAVVVLWREVSPEREPMGTPSATAGWWLTIVLSYVVARGVVRTFAARSKRRLFLQGLMSLATTFCIMLPVETMGTEAGIWEWRSEDENFAMVHAIDPAGECPAFVPYASTGALEFPVATAFFGWNFLSVLPATTFLFVLTESQGSRLRRIGRALLLGVAPVSLVVAGMAGTYLLFRMRWIEPTPARLSAVSSIFPLTEMLAASTLLFAPLALARRFPDREPFAPGAGVGSNALRAAALSMLFVAGCVVAVLIGLGQPALAATAIPLLVLAGVARMTARRIGAAAAASSAT